jgi:hypothetical protein
MNWITLSELLMLMALGMFFLGLCSFITGIVLLVSRAWGKEVRSLAVQSTRLAQKGIAEEIAGLVGNASTLLNAVNELVRTVTGIGVFLTVVGLGLMALAFYFVLQLGTL